MNIVSILKEIVIVEASRLINLLLDSKVDSNSKILALHYRLQ